MERKCTWCKHHEMSTETVDEWLERCEGYCDKHDYIVDSLSYSCEHFEAKEGKH